MQIRLQRATLDDVSELVSLRSAVNERLAKQFGGNTPLAVSTEAGLRFAMTKATIFVARHRSQLIATLTLSTRKPWAIDKSYFHVSQRPLYLTNMAVDPNQQRKGVGRQCLREALRIATEWPGDAIRLDAYDAAFGAGDFYKNCGFQEVGRAIYRRAQLVYFEMLL